ncbi:MAG: ATP-dependent Clp protease ATP-binding subunit [bacterium]|nr:ATP-dependent Clp protease ATP-binding subunit [bacterium]
MKLCYKCKSRPAVVFIQEMNAATNEKKEPKGLCLLCAKEAGIKPINDMLTKMNITDEDIEQLSEQFMEMLPMGTDFSEDDSDDGFQFGGAATFPIFSSFSENTDKNENVSQDNVSKTDSSKKKKGTSKRRRFLEQFCTNLTEKARNGQLDRIIGRENELYRTIQILSRRSKNNPCLIGEPGVGKTAIAEGLALKIAENDAPARLLDKEIHLLDLTGLLAGTQFRGQFESRVKGLIEEVKEAGNIILFVDEVHNLVGAGDSEGSMNAGNILKPALSRGEIQLIGATTFKEYRKYIEKDAALERRFQPIIITEPSVADAEKVLLGVRDYYEGYHGVTVSDYIVKNAVLLSERYITDRFLPDKAIDLLDEACACASLRNKSVDELYVVNKKIAELSSQEEQLEQNVDTPDYEKLANVRAELAKYKQKADSLYTPASVNEVTDDDLARVLELWTGISAGKIKTANLDKLSVIHDKLSAKIIGQPQAVDAVALGVRRCGVQISSHRRPVSFIFIGPTGVGKTELAKVLADEMFDTPDSLIRLDMSEYMEKHSSAKLIGSPPGYVGYDDAGQLTEKVRRKPYSIILFDEIEKAHPDVLNILLQILDDGRVTDSQGRTVSFENTVIIMTTNAGSNTSTNLLGFGKSEDSACKEKAVAALEEFLRPEFLGRVDEIIPFNKLDFDSLKKISELILNELKDSLSEKNIQLKWTDFVCKYIAENCDSNKRGARDIRRIIRKEIEDKIVSIIIDNREETVDTINVSVSDNKISIDCKYK